MAMNDGGTETVRLYAWIARDLDGIEGIITVPSSVGFMPLVTTDLDQAHRLAPLAADAAQARTSVARLVRFERAAELRTLSP